MFKRLLGFLFVIIAIVLCLGFLVTLPETISMIFSNLSAYSFGYVTGSAIFLVLSIFLFKLGLKNIPKNQNIINEIGKN